MAPMSSAMPTETTGGKDRAAADAPGCAMLYVVAAMKAKTNRRKSRVLRRPPGDENIRYCARARVSSGARVKCRIARAGASVANGLSILHSTARSKQPSRSMSGIGGAMAESAPQDAGVTGGARATPFLPGTIDLLPRWIRIGEER